MKKSKLSIGLMTALLGVTTLAGCNTDVVKYSPEGTIIKYTVDGKTTSIDAEQLFIELADSKYETIFEALKSIVIRNYFYVDTGDYYDLPNGGKFHLGTDDLPELEMKADHEVTVLTDTARTNANANNTNYDDELDSLLGGKNLKEKTLEAYRQSKLDEFMEERFTENFYKYYRDILVEGDSNYSEYWKGYFEENVPYHISHILVKFDDTSGSDYATDKISEQSALNLDSVVSDLIEGSKTFGQIAYSYGIVDEGKYADAGSAKQYGDLGIMGFNTDFVPEFKLGVYAYENFFGKYFDKAQESIKVQIPEIEDINDTEKSSVAREFRNEMKNAIAKDEDDSFPSVSADVFKQLAEYADVTKDKDGEKVMDGNEVVYPRNLIYNRYLNRHSFMFITPGEDDSPKLDADFKNGTPGFHTYTNADFETTTETSPLNGKTVLSVKLADEYRPILMVRAGGSYQGIHFIVVNRDYFCETDKNEVTRSEYYTTYHIDQEKYPTDGSGNPKKTYVNFNRLETSQSTDSRADELFNNFKGFETTKQSRYFFAKYLDKENLHLKDQKLDYGLRKWLQDQIDDEQEDFKEDVKEEWKNYVSTLRKQNNARKNLYSVAAQIAFDEDLDTYVDTDGKITKTDFTTYCTNETLMTTDEISALMDEIYGSSAAGTASVVLEDLYNVKGKVFNDNEKHND